MGDEFEDEDYGLDLSDACEESDITYETIGLEELNPWSLPDSMAALVIRLRVPAQWRVWGDVVASFALDALEEVGVSGVVEYYAADIGGEYVVALAGENLHRDTGVETVLKRTFEQVFEEREDGYCRQGKVHVRGTRWSWLRSVRESLGFSGGVEFEAGAVAGFQSDPETDTWVVGAARGRWEDSV